VTDPAGLVESIRATWHARRPVKLVAEAEGQLVESTFELVGGWDPADTSLPDEEYGKSSSSDFDAVAHVFRLWVLNEDGAYSGEPFDRGEPFDLTGFFKEEEAIDPQPLRFGNPLTQDGAGRRLSVSVEMSTEDGASWSRYPGAVDVLRDRAGVYLDDDALPDGFLAAAEAGTARVRVTGTLRSPLPLRAVRWRGNPFAGSFETRRLAVGDAFRWWRVATSGKHHEALVAGERSAAEADDRAALVTWLAQTAERRAAAEAGGPVRIEAAGPMVGLRIGDRLDGLAGRRIGAGLTDPAAEGPAAMLERIDHQWERMRSELRWRVS
jgi:hypothetical protein